MITKTYDETIEAAALHIAESKRKTYSAFENSHIERVRLNEIAKLSFFDAMRDENMRFSNADIDIHVVKSCYPVPLNGNWTFGYDTNFNISKKYTVVCRLDETKNLITFYGWIPMEDIKRHPIINYHPNARHNFTRTVYDIKYNELNQDFGALWENCSNNM